jgi:hypothetical protein
LLEQIDDFKTVSTLSLTHPRQLKVLTGRSNDLPLLLGVRNTRKTTQEKVGSIDNCEINAEVLSESLLDLLTLIETHTSVINENGLEAVSNGLTHKGSSNSAVHTAANSAKNESLITNKFTDASNLELNEVAHLPVRLSSADIDTEIAEDLGSAGSLDLIVRQHSGVMPWRGRGEGGTNVFKLRVELDT